MHLTRLYRLFLPHDSEKKWAQERSPFITPGLVYRRQWPVSTQPLGYLSFLKSKPKAVRGEREELLRFSHHTLVNSASVFPFPWLRAVLLQWRKLPAPHSVLRPPWLYQTVPSDSTPSVPTWSYRPVTLLLVSFLGPTGMQQNQSYSKSYILLILCVYVCLQEVYYAILEYMRSAEGIQPCNMKNRDIFWRK